MAPAALAHLVRQRLRSRAVVLNTMVTLELAVNTCGEKFLQMLDLPENERRARLTILKQNHEFVRARFLQVCIPCLTPLCIPCLTPLCIP
jgi:hypothetical protein